MRGAVTSQKISDEAVSARTGKTWGEWCKILDKARAKAMDHKEIVAILSKRYPKLGGWWTQMVTVGYEQARGKRQKHEKPEGFEVSGSKTVAAPVTALYRAWTDEKMRKRWLSDAAF